MVFGNLYADLSQASFHMRQKFSSTVLYFVLTTCITWNFQDRHPLDGKDELLLPCINLA